MGNIPYDYFFSIFNYKVYFNRMFFIIQNFLSLVGMRASGSLTAGAPTTIWTAETRTEQAEDGTCV